MRYTGFSAEVRSLIMARCQGCCEVCGMDGVDHIHHRRARAMGSTRRPETNLPGNGLAVSAACHTMLESRRALALSRGWLVRQTETPTAVPVLRFGAEWVYLTDDGGVVPAPEPKEIA